ncbi:hypothetical protein QR46_1692 [Giardia duodenalis assemblage B]|uniref:Uncharacterized protein n=1 Tax=Giardia duodenalis assemblage B TaxID=1394984 RepID=A0A132NW65_GIAIN|nr:hypothetical protein QR46_1692 [Giardia intestinalis assemblage B]
MPYNPALDCRLKEPGYKFCEGACNCKKCWVYPKLGCYCFNFNKHLATHPQGNQKRVASRQYTHNQSSNQSTRGIYHPPGTTTQSKLRLNNLKSPFSVDHPCPQCCYPLEVTPPGTQVFENGLPPISKSRSDHVGLTDTCPHSASARCRTCEILNSDAPKPCGCKRSCYCTGCCNGLCQCQDEKYGRTPEQLLIEKLNLTRASTAPDIPRPLIVEGPADTNCNPYRTSVTRTVFRPAVPAASCHDQQSLRELERIDREYCKIKKLQERNEEKREVIRELAADVPNCLVNFRQAYAYPKRRAGDTLIEVHPLMLEPYVTARMCCKEGRGFKVTADGETMCA